MAVNDPVADMLIRLRNAANARFDSVNIPHSRVKEAIARVLESRKFVGNVEVVGESPKKVLVVGIKYNAKGKPAFTELKRISKLGRRVYTGADDIKPVRQGLGVAVISTSKGIMKDTDARKERLGGEVLCTAW